MTTESPDDKNRPLGVAPGSQAGDELINEITGIVNTSPSHSEAIKRVAAYAERLATERTIAALGKVDPIAEMLVLRPDGMEHAIRVMDYVAELSATLTGKAAS